MDRREGDRMKHGFAAAIVGTIIATVTLMGCSVSGVPETTPNETPPPSAAATPTGWPEAVRVGAWETCMRGLADMTELSDSRKALCGCMLKGGEQIVAAALTDTAAGNELMRGVGRHCASDADHYGKPAAAPAAGSERPTAKETPSPATAPTGRTKPTPDSQDATPRVGASGSLNRYESAQRLIAKIWARTSFSGKAKICSTWSTNPDLILREILPNDDPAVRIGTERFFEDHC